MGKLLLRTFLVLVILVTGLLAFKFLAGMKKPPDLKEVREIPLAVQGVRAAFDEFTVTLSGYGTVRSARRASISPEVGGQVVFVRSPLESGTLVEAGELLVKIDPRTYALRKESAAAEMTVLEAQIARVNQQEKNDEERRKILLRSRDLASSRYDRLMDLYENKEVGTLSEVEAAESNWVAQENQLSLLDNALNLYPRQVNELDAALMRARVQHDQAALDLARTEVRAPFSGRLADVLIEQGQLVLPGQQIFFLIDDAALEIPVSLDSAEVQRWLLGPGSGEEGQGADWYRSTVGNRCSIRWAESPDTLSWPGMLDRMERFSPDTRTMIAVVKPDSPGNPTNNPSAGALPLAEGMFCTVRIPSSNPVHCVRLPLTAVTHERRIYVSTENRLESRPITLVHENDEQAFIQGNLEEGDIVVTTKLVNPIEGTLLEVVLPEGRGRE